MGAALLTHTPAPLSAGRLLSASSLPPASPAPTAASTDSPVPSSVWWPVVTMTVTPIKTMRIRASFITHFHFQQTLCKEGWPGHLVIIIPSYLGGSEPLGPANSFIPTQLSHFLQEPFTILQTRINPQDPVLSMPYCNLPPVSSTSPCSYCEG